MPSADRYPRILLSSYYDKFLSRDPERRRADPISRLFHLDSRPGTISLLAGRPNLETFPFTSFSFNAHLPGDPTQEMSVQISSEDLQHGLQYCPPSGLPGLVQWLYNFQETLHNRRLDEGWRLSIGNGSQDLLYKAMVSMIDETDSVLVERPAYAVAISILRTMHCKQIEVKTDSEGISSESLRSILSQWPASEARPKVLYTVPCGCNPTGTTTSTARRKEVLALAREYDFLIIEDDPYFHLYYGKLPRPPSYFSLEMEEPEIGRVIRLDSFSKVLAPGLRVGFVSAPAPLVDAIDIYTAMANLNPCSFAQSIALSLLSRWDVDGFIRHADSVSTFYRKRRDCFEKSLQRHLADLAVWKTPEAGMFFWFKPLSSGKDSSEGNSETLILTKGVDKGVLALPGSSFLPGGGKTGYVRAAFSCVDEDEMNEAMRRLRGAILQAQAEAGGM